MKIIEFDSIDVGDKLLVLSSYGKKEQEAVVTEKNNHSLVLNDGQTISIWGRDAGSIAIKADHPEILQGRKNYQVEAVAAALNFGKKELIQTPEIAELLEQIYKVNPEAFDKTTEHLRKFGALGYEPQYLTRIANSIGDQK